MNMTLKIQRISRGLSGKELASRAGISNVYLSLIENGQIPSQRIQKRIAKSLGLKKN